jgi:hypothetical protein
LGMHHALSMLAVLNSNNTPEIVKQEILSGLMRDTHWKGAFDKLDALLGEKVEQQARNTGFESFLRERK